jgi:hypothetical protein
MSRNISDFFRRGSRDSDDRRIHVIRMIASMYSSLYTERLMSRIINIEMRIPYIRLDHLGGYLNGQGRTGPRMGRDFELSVNDSHAFGNAFQTESVIIVPQCGA